METPLHIAIVPDGNRRWAKKNGLKPWEGHEAGAKNLEKILEVVKELDIKYLSFWGSSEDNLRKRPLSEKRALLDIYRRYFKKLTESERVHRNKIKINVLGEWEKQFPTSLKKIIQEAKERTKNYDKYFINFFLAYSGSREMEKTIEKIAQDFKEEKFKKVTDSIIKERLITKELPPVDLLIRTGSLNDPHLSAGFMMWDTQNSQLFFSKKDWPAFNKQDFKKAIKDYGQRIRRYGK
ncbi:MAG: polyprenyl diphosphate synthase [Patescibacteria group bacterium]|nr:polyprenyl diphosphate synthase [Patescibacteria group bacterium]